jgi:DNA-binding response OmpR family regulator
MASAAAKKILIVEDEHDILQLVKLYLEKEGFRTVTATTGAEGLNRAKQDKPDLIVLDLMLPKIDGLEVCKRLRSAPETAMLPIIMLTAKAEESDQVIGLELGADDYVTKPFSIPELLARIKALLRRKGEILREIEECSFGNVQVDFKKQEALKNKKKLKLSVKEFEILKFFVERAGDVITRDMLLDKIWGYETYPVTRTVDNYILSLRKKIEDNPSEPKHLLTVHTAGYKFVLK